MILTDREIRQRFHRAVDATLSGLEGDPLLARRVIHQARQREPERRKKLSVGLLIALAMALVSVTAVAAGLWGVLDFMRLHGKTVLEEAADSVQTGIPQQGGHTAWADFTLREAVCDGRVAYMVLDVTPTDEHTLLIFEDMRLEDSAWLLSSEYPADQSIAQFAQEKGYARIVRVGMGEAAAEETNEGLSMDMKLVDGVMTLIVTRAYRCAGTADIALMCITAPLDGDKETAVLTATLQVDDPLWTVDHDRPVDYPEAGIRIERVSLTGTTMAVYADVAFTVTDQAIYDGYEGGFWLSLVDASGKELPCGARGMGSVDSFDETKKTIRLSQDIQAMAQPPASIGIYAYSAWTKEGCEPVTILLGE